MLDHEVDEPPEIAVDRRRGRLVRKAARGGREWVRIAALPEGGGEPGAIEPGDGKGEIEFDEAGDGIGEAEPAPRIPLPGARVLPRPVRRREAHRPRTLHHGTSHVPPLAGESELGERFAADAVEVRRRAGRLVEPFEDAVQAAPGRGPARGT